MTLVELPPGPARMPASCANCGAPPVAAHAEGGARKLLIPYCKSCYSQLLRQGTRQIAATLASLLVVVTLLLTLPWVSPGWGRLAYMATAVFGAVVPVLLVALVRTRESEQQTSDGRAVWWASPNELGCTRKAFADELLQLNAAKARTVARRPPIIRAMMWAGVALAIVVNPFAYEFLHPEVWVLNLGAPELSLSSGSTQLGNVAPSSLESPASGLRVRLGVGARELRAVDPSGQLVARRRVSLSAGERYLFAPLSDGHCFWLERDHYGLTSAQGAATARIQALATGRDFWKLPSRIDNWFAQNPEPADDRRFSGGSLTALRHARCGDAPKATRGR